MKFLTALVVACALLVPSHAAAKPNALEFPAKGTPYDKARALLLKQGLVIARDPRPEAHFTANRRQALRKKGLIIQDEVPYPDRRFREVDCRNETGGIVCTALFLEPPKRGWRNYVIVFIDPKNQKVDQATYPDTAEGLPGMPWPLSGEDDGLPLRFGQPLAQARAALLAAGWKPIETFNRVGDAKSPFEHHAEYGAASSLYKKGYIEVESCSGTGLAYCMFAYMREGKCLELVSRGEDHRTVDNWMRTCPSEIKAPPGMGRCKDATDVAGTCRWMNGTFDLLNESVMPDDNHQDIRIVNDWPRNLNRLLDRASLRKGIENVRFHGQFLLCPIRRKDSGTEFKCIEAAEKLKAVPQVARRVE